MNQVAKYDSGLPCTEIDTLKESSAPVTIKNSEGKSVAIINVDHAEYLKGTLAINGWFVGASKIELYDASTKTFLQPVIVAEKSDGKSDVYNAKSKARFSYSVKTTFQKKYLLRIAVEENAKSFNQEFYVEPKKPAQIRFSIDENLYFVGSHLDLESTTPSTVTVLVDGVVAAEGKANLPSPELLEISPEKIMSGFKIRIPRTSLTKLEHSISCRVDDITVGRAITLDLATDVQLNILGIKESKLCCELLGWKGGNISGEVYVDGLLKGSVRFEESAGATHGDPISRIGKFVLPEELSDGQKHTYSVQISHPKKIFSSDVKIYANPQFYIHIDTFSDNMITGWAFKAGDSAPLTLRLSVVGPEEFKTSTKCNRYREDVCDARGINFDTGFEFTVPISLCDYDWKIYDEATNILLLEGNITKSYEVGTLLAQYVFRSERKGLRHVAAAFARSVSGNIELYTHYMPPKERETKENEVAIIIPVYGGRNETIECIQSVLAAKNHTKCLIVIVNDCSPDALICDYLRSVKNQNEDIILLTRAVNGGFSEAVNLGVTAAGRRDVILLNADTVVQDHWVDRMLAIAKSNELIGTVTPLSNNAEICTVPYTCKALPVQTPSLAKQIDSLAQSVNRGKYVPIPVAVGFCMLIKRTCLDEIGLFDSALWGRGYGEEVDFCLKAAERGWIHAMAADTFVVHRGNVSFGNEKLERIIQSAKKISEKYRFYDCVIQRYLANDPTATVRRALNISLIGSSISDNRTLHVSHNYGGGTEKYLNDVCQLEKDENHIILRFADDGASQMEFNTENTELEGFFLQKHEEKFTKLELEELKESIKVLKFTRVHIHAPLGVPVGLLKHLVDTYNTQITVHDYAWICPRVTLTQAMGRYCGEPDTAECNNCMKLYGPHKGLAHLLGESRDILKYRKDLTSILGKATIVHAGSQDVVARLKQYKIKANFNVTPHPVVPNTTFARDIQIEKEPISDRKVRVALIGGISDIKGYYILKECIKEAERNHYPLEFIVFGNTKDNDELRNIGNVRILGAYKDEELDSLVASIKPDIAFFPNQWPETYSYTLSHAFRYGLPIVATDIGAPAERIRNHDAGVLFDIDTPAVEICKIILKTVTQSVTQVKSKRHTAGRSEKLKAISA